MAVGCVWAMESINRWVVWVLQTFTCVVLKLQGGSNYHRGKGERKSKKHCLTIYPGMWGYKQTIDHGPGVEHCPVHTTKCRTESLEDFLFTFLIFLPSCPEISLGLWFTEIFLIAFHVGQKKNKKPDFGSSNAWIFQSCWCFLLSCFWPTADHTALI